MAEGIVEMILLGCPAGLISSPDGVSRRREVRFLDGGVYGVTVYKMELHPPSIRTFTKSVFRSSTT